MSWEREQARAMKARAVERVGEVLAGQDVTAAAQLGGAPIRDEPGPTTVGVSLGLSPVGDGTFRLAVRYRHDTEAAEMVTRSLAEEFGPDADVRRTGPVVALMSVVPTAQAQGQTGRVRPLQPGVSVANAGVTAGTLGGFVDVDGVTHVLSNHHVLVGDTGQEGDAVLQPGPADGGTDPQDRIGSLAAFVPLTAGQPATVDAALSTLADAVEEAAGGPAFDPTYPGGPLTGTVEVEGGEQVEKTGRTSGVTQGVVTAIELDDVIVDFGPVLGQLSFDGQIEVESSGSGPFSQGGDSGSLVYRPDTREAVGLLFAGGDQGGSNGQGLTYLNPIGAVLDALGGELRLDADADAPGADDPGAGDAPGPDRPQVRDSWAPVQPRADAGRTRDAVRAQVAGVPGVTGVGLSPAGDGYAVVVNVTGEEVLDALPESVRASARIRYTGPISARQPQTHRV